MHISEFQIKNFKSFENVKVYFNEKTNVFTGVNNAGKSTMLEAISLWQECYTKLIRRTDSANNAISVKGGDFVFAVKAGKSISYMDIISVRSPGYADIFYNLDKNRHIQLIAKLKIDNQYLVIGFSIASVDGANYYKIALINYDKFNYRLFNDKNVIKNPETAIKVLYASPLANITPQEERLHSLKIQYLKQSHTAHSAFRNRIESLHQRRGDTGNPYDTFREQLSDILEGDSGQIKFSFPDVDNLNLKLNIQIGADNPKDISLVGSGTLQIIEILLNIHEQKSEFNIVLLDEPDSHIHRQLQVRLLNVLNTSDNTQVFITTHNEAMIREAEPDWIFHLEKQPNKEYYPIQRDKTAKRGLLSSAKSPVIQTLGGKSTGLDFITALEAEVLFMVEGVNDALRIQKIMSFKNNDMRKYAYWVMGNVDTIFDQLSHYKTVFTEIKNDKTLWEKTVLVFDKDVLTDLQREKLMDAIKSKLKLKQVYIWQAYSFDSILFSNLSFLSQILQRYIRSRSSSMDTSDLTNKLNQAMEKLLAKKLEGFKVENILPTESRIRDEMKKREAKFEKLGFSNIIDKEFHLQKVIRDYLNNACNTDDLHKIMVKDDCETILKEVFSHFDLNFEMEGNGKDLVNFNDLMSVVTIATRYNDWDFILKI